jgi:hypothetical protein
MSNENPTPEEEEEAFQKAKEEAKKLADSLPTPPPEN